VAFEEPARIIGETLAFRGERGADTAETELRHIKNAIVAELTKRTFVAIGLDRVAYFGQDKLFGEAVFVAFPSARQDVRNAGDCCSVELSSAAVFHLMRVAEHGLRALARDREIKLPKKAVIDLATWEDIIKQLENAESSIQSYPKSLAREAQFEFYHGAMMEFKRFKNKFRNRIMHTRKEYDRDEAHSALTHVREFMRILASRISENTKTPQIWKGKKWTAAQVH
jgi:hypothetical protein